MISTRNKDYIYTVGRRKSAVARIRVYDAVLPEGLKKGDVMVNGKPIADYFPRVMEKAIYEIPFKLTNNLGKFAITIRASGGGREGQLDAIVLGISRAFSQMGEDTKKTLRKNGLLTRDARVRERRKVGTGGKARRAKQSPKR